MSSDRLWTSSQDQTARGDIRVLVVGAGTRFLSAMSYFSIRITNALATRFPTAVIPMRQLIPTFLYPGRTRVGSTSTFVRYDTTVSIFPEVDWFWVPNLIRAFNRTRKWKPDVIIFEWWTGTVLHTYLVMAIWARLRGVPIVVEIHELGGGGEEQIPVAQTWVRALGWPFFKLASAFVIHSEADRQPVEQRFAIRGRPCVVIPIGPHDHHAATSSSEATVPVILRDAPADAFNILFFGIIRPYKGLEDLVRAFDAFSDEEVSHYWLTVVGETWEGWDLPVKLIEQNRHRERITLVNRFVTDEDVIAYFGGADAVVLPYHRSSASSPAHVAMSNGLPLVVTAVGGLPEAVADYGGAILVPPHDPVALQGALRLLPPLIGRRYADPHSWERTVASYEALIDRLDRPARPGV